MYVRIYVQVCAREKSINTKPWGRLNIKMPSNQYKDSHVKDKTVSQTVYSLTWESSYPRKTVFILGRGIDIQWQQQFTSVVQNG